MYGIMPYMCHNFFTVEHKHNSLPLGPKQPSSPTTKEIYGQGDRRCILFRSPLHALFKGCLWAVWPDWAIYWTLDNFLKPLATINLPKSPTFLGNFWKVVKICHFSGEIISGQLLLTFGDIFLVTLLMTLLSLSGKFKFNAMIQTHWQLL